MFKKLLAVPHPAGLVAGCNAIEGAGRHFEGGGEKIQDSAGKHKN